MLIAEKHFTGCYIGDLQCIIGTILVITKVTQLRGHHNIMQAVTVDRVPTWPPLQCKILHAPLLYLNRGETQDFQSGQLQRSREERYSLLTV